MTRHDQDRKTRILQAIAEGIRRSGTPPTVREIADLVGLAAPSAVHHHLETLEQEGLIERGAGLSRSVRLTARGRSLLEIDSELETTNLPMAARELVQHKPDATREDVREWMSGNYCRCTGYHAIVDAVCEVLAQRNLESAA